MQMAKEGQNVTGLTSAAPILFDVFCVLRDSFCSKPEGLEFTEIKVVQKKRLHGYRTYVLFEVGIYYPTNRIMLRPALIIN